MNVWVVVAGQAYIAQILWFRLQPGRGSPLQSRILIVPRVSLGNDSRAWEPRKEGKRKEAKIRVPPDLFITLLCPLLGTFLLWYTTEWLSSCSEGEGGHVSCGCFGRHNIHLTRTLPFSSVLHHQPTHLYLFIYYQDPDEIHQAICFYICSSRLTLPAKCRLGRLTNATTRTHWKIVHKTIPVDPNHTITTAPKLQSQQVHCD